MEGNFPPQVLEALYYRTPVVSTRLAPIYELLRENTDKLLLCAPLDVEEFLSAVLLVVSERERILERQDLILQLLQERNSHEAFHSKLASALHCEHSVRAL
jgi:hypothetical protein